VTFPRAVRTTGSLSALMVAACLGLWADTAAAAQTKPKATPKATTSSSRAARTRRARNRAAARAQALREAQQPRFKIDDLGALVPDIRAEAAIVYNSENGEVLWESNSQDLRSIASITKVMTATVFLEEWPDLSEPVVVQRSDVRAASTTYLRAGYKVTKGDLLHLLLMASDNAAARARRRSSCGRSSTRWSFVYACTVVMKPCSIVNASCRTFAMGATQFVVQDALDRMLCAAGS